jgi:hypothetical protein
MKKIFIYLLSGLVLSSCMKKPDLISPSNDFASVAFINAAPGSTSATSLTSGHVFVDNNQRSSSVVGYRVNSGYISVSPGTRAIDFRSVTPDSAKFVNYTTENFEARKAYTVIVYDTLSASSRVLKSVRLEDDLTLPTAGTANVRFLHLAPLAGAVDVTFLRTNVTPNDSVTILNKTFIGSSPDQKGLSEFNITLPLGVAGLYTVKVKTAGTQTVLVQGNVNLTTAAGNQGIATVYVTGGAAGQPLGLGIFRHYP